MKKIISALLALMMLGQTAFARTLQEFVQDDLPAAWINSDSIFDYKNFAQYLNDPARPEIIPAEVTTTVKLHNEGSYESHPRNNVLNSNDAAKTAFDFKAELDMTNVKNAFNLLYDAATALLASDAALKTQFEESTVTGSFQVNVDYDAGLTFASNTECKLMQDGSESVLFTQATPDTTVPNKATFVFGINGTVTVQNLKDNIDTYFDNLYMEIKNVKATIPDTDLAVTVSMDPAKTEFFDISVNPEVKYATISYKSQDVVDAATHKATAVVRIPAPTTPPTPPTPPSGGGVSATPKLFTVVENDKTQITLDKESGKYFKNVDEIERPVREGYVFDGWYLDVGFTTPVTGVLNVIRTTNIYGRFLPIDETAPRAFTVVEGVVTEIPVEHEGDSFLVHIDKVPDPEKEGFVFNGWYLDPLYQKPVSGTISIIEDTYIYAQFINITAPSKLISDEHILYIVGYPDGEVKPNGLITREEVAAAFYRLLEPTYRASIETVYHSFPDVSDTRWSREEIATLANGGIIVGDENGNFNPGKPITRAEFVTMATKFAEITDVADTNIFTDITGHWAEEFILAATNGHHWITGYEDHTFRPDNSITRAEAMTIINKMLVRYGDVTSEHAMQWPDLFETDWYYSNVIEATTEHDFTRKADGWNETWSFGTGVDDEVIESVSGSHITK